MLMHCQAFNNIIIQMVEGILWYEVVDVFLVCGCDQIRYRPNNLCLYVFRYSFVTSLIVFDVSMEKEESLCR